MAVGTAVMAPTIGAAGATVGREGDVGAEEGVTEAERTQEPTSEDQVRKAEEAFAMDE